MQITILFVPLQSLLKGICDQREQIPFQKHIGELAEWSNAAVLKTVDLNGSGGSNPSLSAEKRHTRILVCLFFLYICLVCIIVGYTIVQTFELMNTNLDKAYFISFCIEQYKNEKGISGSEAMALLSEYGVLEYLSEHWEILHTQSRQWIIEDIDEFIRTRKGE